MATQDSDTQIWLSFQQGDEAAYTVLYRTHVRAMYRYGMSLVAVSESFVFDCIHDVFTEIWAKRERLSVPDNIRYYLLKSLKVRIVHLLQRQQRPHQVVAQTDFDDLWAEPSVEELFSEQEESVNREALIQKLISQLPPRQQEALRLRFVEELDYSEIADVLAINRQSAQNLVFRGMEKLRQWLIGTFLLFLSFF
ncbi:RNA polymerase sigma factor [Fibrella aquatica]|uniref:RNA polymerase sigma factor n=1 Tax=Fibrella aquatica TaxID=3242487 RepID=UPI0035226E38